MTTVENVTGRYAWKAMDFTLKFLTSLGEST